jgi:AcrR family transcriptional regulator
MKDSAPRHYVMTARARSTEETGDRILAAIVALFIERPYSQITLREVAERAHVSVQTVIRRYGDKAGLTEAAAAHFTAVVSEQRGHVTPGDLRGAVDNLVDHYEDMGQLALRLLEEEAQSPAIAALAAAGRALHGRWCARVFEPRLAALSEADRRLRLAQLVAVCDVYTWKVLREQGLDSTDTRRALTELLEPLLVQRSP